jgi:hypothetical protein
MAFDINDFKQKGLRYGGARPSLFEVVVTPPPGVAVAAAGIEKFPFVCRAAELPESTIGNIEIPYFGRKIKVAGERTFADWSVTVMNDEDFAVRTMFEAWQNAINTIVSNVRIANPIEDYKTLIDVTQFAKDGEAIRSYQLVGAFPTAVSGITLGWDSANAIEEFTVNFSYDYWIPLIIGTTVLSAKTSGQVTDFDVEATPTGGPIGI